MKGRPLDQLVYEAMFPKPRSPDPQNFQALLQRHLIVEVRQEVQAFYGHLDTPEAKYPGLDYSRPIHRVRLSRWPWHRRLFRAFDALGLTPHEIATLTKWEGTKWAKERYEKEHGTIIRDTASDGIPDWVEPSSSRTDLDVPYATPIRTARRPRPASQDIIGTVDDDMDESEDEVESVGIALNARLQARAAQREAGDTSAVLDEEWEQWFKQVIETGTIPDISEHFTQQLAQHSPAPHPALFPAQMLRAARAGDWHEIPDFLHELLRRTLEIEPEDMQDEPSTPPTGLPSPPSSTPGSGWRRTYSDLRLPGLIAQPSPLSSRLFGS